MKSFNVPMLVTGGVCSPLVFLGCPSADWLSCLASKVWGQKLDRTRWSQG